MSESAADRTVQIRYATRNKDGALLESNQNREPVTVSLNDPQLVPALRRELSNMQPGDKRKIYAYPEEAFGVRDVQLLHRFPKEFLIEPALVGKQIQINYLSQSLSGWVLQSDGDDVLIDCNHPLVGEMIIYDVEMVG